MSDRILRLSERKVRTVKIKAFSYVRTYFSADLRFKNSQNVTIM